MKFTVTTHIGSKIVLEVEDNDSIEHGEIKINAGCTLSDYNISMKFTKREKTAEQETDQNEKDERSVQVEKEEPTKMQINIEANDGKKYTLIVDKRYTIEQVKAVIPDSSALLNDQQSLSFNGAILDDKKTISDYNIQTNATLKLMNRMPDKMAIFIRTVENKRFRIDVDNNATILKIKRRIMEMLKYPVEQQILRYGSMIFENHQLFTAYKMPAESTLDLVVFPQNPPNKGK
ncbi:hypothetical protein WR25_10299 [Diploscapter pachys]|uniref:Ubiquitin-like domain-containing protein n=1 Tax=Diploscapter pachys TaxID=2018661 RepID=A0A2A2KYE3_9BILA|nr:hypothetical protein WR25_10299 [Diploscapter pachys]